MSILKVARMGHPILRKVAQPVPLDQISSPEIQRLIDNMIATMHEYNGLGLAAPQVHESLRLAVIEFEDENPKLRHKELVGLQVFINPEVEFLTEKRSGSWEGCLSVPGLRGFVERPNKIRLKYYDRHGRAHETIVEGFLATVIQHEFDHLDGKLYIDRIEDLTKLIYDEEFERLAREA